MWQLLFWGCVGLVVYAYAGYPAILFVWGRLRPRRRRTEPAPVEPPRVAVVVSAWNEAAVIRRRIENCLELDWPRDRLSIVVADDGSTDETVSIAREYVELGVRVVHDARRRGKSAVLNDVVPHLDADVVVFTDANSRFESDAVRRLVERFADERVGCVVGRLRYVDPRRSASGRGEGLYWRYEGALSRLESRLGRVLVANGSIFAMRRSLFRPLYPDVANDFQIPVDVRAQGFDVLYAPDAVATEPVAARWDEEFGRKVRIVLRGLTGYARLRSRIRGVHRWQFVSHKLLRWFVGAAALGALVASAALADGAFYAAALGAQAAFYAAAAVGWATRRREPPLRWATVPCYFAMVNAAALVALARFVSGERLSVWSKAESAREALAGAAPAPAADAASNPTPSSVARPTTPGDGARRARTHRGGAPDAPPVGGELRAGAAPAGESR